MRVEAGVLSIENRWSATASRKSEGGSLPTQQVVAVPCKACPVDDLSTLANRLQGPDEKRVGRKRLAETSCGTDYDQGLAAPWQGHVE